MKHKKKRFKFGNKKAIGNEVDWIVAIGVFLLYLTLTFVFFKPGIKPVYNPDTMLSIVEENFRNGAYWTITTQPMFVEPILYKCTGGTPPTTTDTTLATDSGNCANFRGSSIAVEFAGTLSGGGYSGNFPIRLGEGYYQKENVKVFFVAGDKQTADTPPGNVVNTRDGSERRTESSSSRRTSLENTILRNKGNVVGICGGDLRNAQGIENIINKIRECCDEIVADDDRTERRDENRVDKCNDALALVSQYEALGTSDSESAVVSRESLTTNILELRDGYVNNFGISDGNNLVFVPLFRTGEKTKYIITYSNDVINLDSSWINEVLHKACIIPNYPTGYSPGTTCHARYEMGVAESFSGLSVRRLLLYGDFPCVGGQKKGYDCVKDNWGFPSNKDFKIRIYSTGVQKAIAEFPKENVIPSNVNVYSRQFSTFILNEDGLRKPVNVNILVW